MKNPVLTGVMVLAILVAADARAEVPETGIIFDEPLQAEPGDPVDCINARAIRRIEILNNEILIVTGTHDHYWVNQLPRKCVGLRKNMILHIERFGSQICRNDAFEAYERADIGPFTAHCRWGEFQPAVLEQIFMIKNELEKS